jgi:hypothetical protein
MLSDSKIRRVSSNFFQPFGFSNISSLMRIGLKNSAKSGGLEKSIFKLFCEIRQGIEIFAERLFLDF